MDDSRGSYLYRSFTVDPNEAVQLNFSNKLFNAATNYYPDGYKFLLSEGATDGTPGYKIGMQWGYEKNNGYKQETIVNATHSTEEFVLGGNSVYYHTINLKPDTGEVEFLTYSDSSRTNLVTSNTMAYDPSKSFNYLGIRTVDEGSANLDSMDSTFTDLSYDRTPAYTLSTVSGQVIDQNGDPIGSATVAVQETGATTTSAADGSYSFELSDGSYTIEATKTGYNPGTESVTVSGSAVTGANITISKNTVSGAVEAQDGTNVANATVEVWAVNDSINKDPGQTLEEAQRELLGNMSNPLPDSYVEQDLQEAGSGVDSEQVLIHSKSAWLKDAEFMGVNTGFRGVGDISSPLIRLEPSQEYEFSIWDLSRGSSGWGETLNEDAVNRQWRGKTTGGEISIERIGPTGEVTSSATRETEEKYTTAWGVGLGTRNTHETVTVSLHEPGVYRAKTDTGLTTWFIVGSKTSLIQSYEQDLRDKAGNPTERANDIATKVQQDTVKVVRTTTDANGNFNADVPTGYSTVSVTAYKAGGLLEPVAVENRSLQEVRERIATEDYNGSVYLATKPQITDSPSSGNVVRVTEISRPTFMDISDQFAFSDWLEELARTESYGEIQTEFESRLSELTDSEAEGLANELSNVTHSNKELRDRTNELIRENENLQGDLRTLRQELRSGELTRGEMLGLIRTQNRAIAELKETIESEPYIHPEPPEYGDETVSVVIPFRGSLSEDGTSVTATFQNGTTKQVPKNYWSVSKTSSEDATGSATHDYVNIEEYPLPNSSAIINFQIITANDDGIGKETVRVKNPNVDADAPSIDSFNFNTLRPGADSNVKVEVDPSDDSTFTGVNSATVYAPDGSTLPTTVSGNTVEFTTSGSGSYLAEFELATSDGENFTETIRFKAGKDDVPMPPGVRVRSGITGTYAVVGDGIQRAKIRRSGGETTIGAVVPANSSLSEIHVYTGDGVDERTEKLNIRVLRGEDERSGTPARVFVHSDKLPSDAHVWRDGVPITEEGTSAGKINQQSGATVIETYTESDGSTTLKINANPGFLDGIWFSVRSQFPNLGSSLTGTISGGWNPLLGARTPGVVA